MADQVNRLMEAMIPELDDYRRRSLFTAQEIAAIVSQRRSFEYKLARRIPQQADYLTYIAYELNLNQLRKKRKAKLRPAGNAASASASHTSLSDHAGLSRICFLFERCLRHFHSSRPLWLHYLHFLTAAQSHRRLALTLPRAHLLLPHSPQLWMAHAQHCFDTTADMAALRAVMQRAVRLMRGRAGEESVWLGWFGYEVGFIAKVMERKRVLGLNVRDGKQGDFDVRYKAGGAAAEGKQDNKERESARQTESKKGLDEMVLTAVLPKLIYTNATTPPSSIVPSDRQYLISRKKRKRNPLAVPPHTQPSTTRQLHTSLPLRLAFLSLIPAASNHRYDPHSLPSTSVRRLVHSMRQHERTVYVRRVGWGGLLEAVYGGLETQCGGVVEAVTVVAEWKRRRRAESGNGEDWVDGLDVASEARGWAVYEAAVGRGVSGVWTAYLQYLAQRLEVQGLDQTVLAALTQQLATVTQRLVAMAELPSEEGLAVLLSELLVRMGDKQQAIRVLSSINKRQRNATAWQLQARLTDNDEKRAAVWQEAVAALPETERHIALLEHLNERTCAADDTDTESVLTAFQSAFSLSNHPALITAYLDYLTTALLAPSHPIPPTRLRNLLLTLPLTDRSSLAVLGWCDQQGLVDAGLVRRLWEHAVSARGGGDVEVWRRWMAWEQAQGDVAAANRVRWRAEKVLGPRADLQQLDGN